MDDAKYIMTMAGQEELAKQLDGMLKSMVGKEGLKGIDTKRPLGFYGTVGKNLVDSTGVALVPVADEKAFVELLDGMNLNVKKGQDGVYSFTPPNSPADAYFRFANKYAYIAPASKDAIAKDKLLVPASVLAEKSDSAFAISRPLRPHPGARSSKSLPSSWSCGSTTSWKRSRREKPRFSTSSGPPC